MEESKALSKLNDATDLLILLEELLNPVSIERISSASWSGVRLTLKNARQILQESQISLSTDFVSRARTSQSAEAVNNGQPISERIPSEGLSSNGSNPILNSAASQANQDFLQDRIVASSDKNGSEQSKVQITRRDLKTTLERFIESR